MKMICNNEFLYWIVLVATYVVTLLLSGVIVKLVVGQHNSSGNNDDEEINKRRDVGAILGKCENFLAITFILANQITGLALIFMAKSIVRAEIAKKDPKYYLGGTMVNFCFSVLMGFIAKIVLKYLGFYQATPIDSFVDSLTNIFT